jgi:Tol biopolymer transport system component
MLCAGLFLSCKKDLIPIITQPTYNDLEYGWIEEEDDTTYQTIAWGNQSVVGFQYRYPQFNPSNPDELVFVKQHFQENIHQLIKYNLKTKKQTILVDGMHIISEPSWSSSGWIAFSTMPSLHLYRIRDDGSQLTLVSDISMSWLPSWSPEGNYLYFAQQTNVSHHTRFVRLNIQTNALDTLIYGVNDPNFMGFNTKINSSNIALSAQDIGTETFYVTLDLNENPLYLQPVFNTSLIENGSGYTNWRC